MINIAKFIDRPAERQLVNRYVDSFMQGTNHYAKYLDSAPSFVTYYSRDMDKSMENPGLGAVREVVGYESPNRYNRIENVPIYGVEEITPDMVHDGISGIDVESELTALIIPDTIQPNVDDLLIFSYHETVDENSSHKIYRVTDINVSSLDSNSYYRIHLMGTNYNINTLNEHQVTDDYNVVYGHIGTNDRTVLLKDEFISARRLEDLFNGLMTNYVTNYFDERLGSFVFLSDISNSYIYSSDVHEFLQSNEELLIDSRTFMKNIKIKNYAQLKRKKSAPKLPFYQYINDIKRFGKVKNIDKYELSQFINMGMHTIENSIFDILPNDYIDLTGPRFYNDVMMEQVYLTNGYSILTDPIIDENSFISIKEELIILLAKVIDTDIDDLSLVDINEIVEYYHNLSKTDRNELNQELFIGIYDKYFIREDMQDIEELNIDEERSNNYIPYVVAFMLKNIHDKGENNISNSKVSSKLLDTLENILFDMEEYNLMNYYYIPILLYILDRLSHDLLNTR